MAKNKNDVSVDETVSVDGDKKMFESTYNAAKLRELLNNGADARTIMEKLEIKSKQVLKQHCLKLIQEDKKYYDIPLLYEKGSSKYVKVSSNGDIKLSKSTLRAQGADVAVGDSFTISVEDGKIILTKSDTDDTAGEAENNPYTN